MTKTEPPDAPLVVAAFLARYFADQEAGAVRSESTYQALFPGFADVVAAELARLQQGERRPDDVEGERLAGYRIVRELGRGGQGIVYLAMDEQLDRQVALKVLPGAFSATVARQRLLREAQAASRLDDPGICTVYDAGEQDGVAYIAMQFVDGETLEELLDAERERHAAGGLELPAKPRVDRLLRVFEAVLRSLHRAHDKRLVHRDIKPSNLMLADDGAAKILDFGLAAFDDHPDGSLTGEVALGTPAYMSPEQLTAREGRVDARSDVFSLAVTMFEMLTLQHPFAAPTRERLYQHILRDEPPELRRLVAGMPKDLDVVLQCGLAKERGRRYASALAFAEDLARVRLGEPIAARRLTSLERVGRWAQRNPVVAGLLLLLFTTLSVFAYAMFDKNRDLQGALATADVANREADAALQNERQARTRSEGLYLAAAAQGQLASDPELGLLLAREGRQRLDHQLTRGALLAALEGYRPRPLVAEVRDAQWVSLAPDGSRLLAACPTGLVLVDGQSRAVLTTIPCPDSHVASVFWSDDATRLVVAERNQLLQLEGSGYRDDAVVVRLHDAVDGRMLTALDGHRGRVYAVDFDDRWILTCDGPPADDAAPRDGVVRLWRRVDGELTFSLDGCGRGACDARFRGNERAGRWPDFEVLSRDGVYRRVQGGVGRVLDERRIVPAGLERLPKVFFAGPGSAYVDWIHMTADAAGLGRDQRLELYECRDDEPPVVASMPPGYRRKHPRGPLLTRSGEMSGRESIQLLHESELVVERKLAMPPRQIVALHEGDRVAFRGSLWRNTMTTVREPTLTAVFADGSLRVWSLRDDKFDDLPAIGGGVEAAAFSRRGDRCAVVTSAGRVRLFDVPGGSQLPSLQGVGDSQWPAIDPAGRRVVVFRRFDAYAYAADDGMRELWQYEYSDHGDVVTTVAAWSPDGSRCAIGHRDGRVVLLDGETGTEQAVVAPAAADDGSVGQLVFDRAGRRLLIVREHASVWDLEQRREVHRFADVPMVRVACFAGAGDRVVLAHTRAHQLRELPGGGLIQAAPIDGAPTGGGDWCDGIPCAVAGNRVLLSNWFDRQGGRVGGDGPCWWLDATTGERQPLPGGPYGRGGLSPDGRFAVLPKADGVLAWFDLDAGRLVRELRGHERAINRVRFSQRGDVFATGWAAGSLTGPQDERHICVWSRDGELLQRFAFAQSAVCWFALDAAGEWVLALSQDGELRRFPVDPLGLLERIDLRELTDAERERFGLR